jgi:hypothetical protein
MEQWERDEEVVDTIMETLAGCADRWHSLDISFHCTEGMFRLTQVCIPNLVALKIDAAALEIEQMKLLTTRSLRSVTLHIMGGFDRCIPDMPLQWDQLTSLTFDCKGLILRPAQGMSLPVALQLLTRCPRLVHFETDLIPFMNDLPPMARTDGLAPCATGPDHLSLWLSGL